MSVTSHDWHSAAEETGLMPSATSSMVPAGLVVYLLLDLHRRQSGVKPLVQQMEQAVIDLLAEYRLPGERMTGAPGIYVNGSKIAALG